MEQNLQIRKNLVKDSLILENIIKDKDKENRHIPVVKMLENTAEKILGFNPTITECRLPIFAPVAKLSENSNVVQEFKKKKGIRTIDTSWGKAYIRGRVILTQTHRDLLDCILLASKHASYSDIDGSVQLFFSARDALRIYGKTENNGQWLIELMEEIRDTVIKLKKNRLQIDFNIIRRIVYFNDETSFYIEFDPTYVTFYQTEMIIQYKAVMPIVLQINNGILKAIVRFLISHKEIKISLSKILEGIGYKIEDSAQKKYTRLLAHIEENKELLSKLGISFNKVNKYFSYKQIDNIFISNPILSRDRSIISIKLLAEKTRQKNKQNASLKQPSLFDFEGEL
ncbi:hypothetical protein [Helicobacter equorum]|uniref:Initiator Rep protein domain-containing protein n=1 Tax=Helicobacter equorum TaxID=361872 RepID=A0A3D8IMZ6_9HELI|nr:hypothetical protein [Helicobacter equorum]RDU66483.1 hypothetical protein CQA54_07220 [Helicobacter equorum]